MTKRARRFTRAAIALAVLAAGSAAAEVYTWVDAAGNVNVSNLAPPAGARVTAVARESATAIARAETARTAAQEAEVRALADRVAELEEAARASRVPPPQYVIASPPRPAVAPAPQLTVTTMPLSTDEPPVAAPPCAWVGCTLPLGAAYYAAPLVVVTPALNRRGSRVTHRPRAIVPVPAAHALPGATIPPRAPRRG